MEIYIYLIYSIALHWFSINNSIFTLISKLWLKNNKKKIHINLSFSEKAAKKKLDFLQNNLLMLAILQQKA